MKTLHIGKGFTMDTETGYQEIMTRHGSTSYVVHNFDFDGNYTFASILTDTDIKSKVHDMTGKAYDSVCFDGDIWYAVQKDPTDEWGYGSYSLEEAEDMAREQLYDYPDTLIAVIDNPGTEKAFCINEIRDF